MEKNLFISTFYTIIEAQEFIGTPDAYCKILYSIFGSNATITIDEKNPLHIKIDIIARYVEYFYGSMKNINFMLQPKQATI